MSGFQKQVNAQPAPAVAGDFASANPRATVLAGPGGLVAGAQGVTVGRFAWVASDGVTVNNFDSTSARAPDGFVHREENALITQYLGEASMLVPTGFEITLIKAGDVWALNNGPSACNPGDAVYANYADGSVTTGSAPTGASATGSIGATFTATGTGTSLAVTSVTGLISIGDTISGTGVTAGTTIVAQVSGTTGGAGTYTTSAATTAAGGTVTSFGNVLNVTAVASGTLKVGDPVSGTGVPANAVIASQVSGATGGIGVYTISIAASAYAASTTLTVTGGVQATPWKCQSSAAVGELVKISTWG